MAEKITLSISPAVAGYVRRGVGVEEKRRGLAAAAALSPHDQLMLLFCLVNDPDPGIKESARTLFLALPDEILCSYLRSSGVQPGVRNLIARVHGTRPAVAAVMAVPVAVATLSEVQDADAGGIEPADDGHAGEQEGRTATDVAEELPLTDEAPLSESDLEALTAEFLAETLPEQELPDDELEPVNEEAEEFQSKYRMAQVMGIGEKIKMALTGDKEWRSLLIKDANKLVSGGVVKNPRITDGEILTILKVGVQNDEIVRIICANKEWVKNYKIRKALIDCPKTPLPNALRYLASLDVKDLAGYAKSKNISSVLSTQAKRMLLAKKR